MEGGSGGVNRGGVLEESKYPRLWSLRGFVVHHPFKESRRLKEWDARDPNSREKGAKAKTTKYHRQLNI